MQFYFIVFEPLIFENICFLRFNFLRVINFNFNKLFATKTYM